MLRRLILIIGISLWIFSCNTKPTVVIVTSKGEIEIELDTEFAPKHSENFLKLINERYYIGTTFHRVEPGYLIQGGDPNSKDSDRSNDGAGGPSYRIDAEIKLLHKYASVGAARWPDQVNPQRQSNGSQFYICLKDMPALDRGGYTVFGKVVRGMDVVEKISLVEADPRNNPLNPVLIEQAYVK